MSKKLRCFLKKFTQLTKILHDRRSRRSRQIPSLWSACRRGGDISITPRERDISPLSSHHRQSNVSSRACDTPPLMTSVCFNIQMFPKKKWWRRSSWFKVALSLIATWRRWKKVAYWRNWSEAKGDFSNIEHFRKNIFGNFTKAQSQGLPDLIVSTSASLQFLWGAKYSRDCATHSRTDHAW